MHSTLQLALACAVVSLWLTAFDVQADETANAVGKQIFAQKCAECHGDRGQGVAGAADDPLYGSRSLEELTQAIAETMPEGEPEACVGEEARSVASYIYDSFYTMEARTSSKQARVELMRMTVPQYRQSVADLVGARFLGKGDPGEEQGLSAEYFNERHRRKDKRLLERVDPTISFDFGEGPALSQKDANKEEFLIRWEGSLLAEDSGTYEIIVRTGNGMRLWLNDPDHKLIDAWVSSGGKVMEHRVEVELLAGRAYPLSLEFFKYKDKTASIELLWKPPHKAEEIIPSRHLRTRRVPHSFIVTTPFPPDDRSVGYERGSAVSQAWDEATTYAAIETAQFVSESIDRFAGTNSKDKDRHAKWQRFCERFATRAFRHPLTDEQKKFFIEQQFAATTDPDEAVKRVVLLVMKSPRFLYLGLDQEHAPDYAVASRLSYALWDSLPDDTLLQAASRNELHTAEQVSQQAQRMLKHPLAKAKLREFFHAWLMLDHVEDLSKDDQTYPDFNEQVVADLRTSLDLMLDSIAWNENADFRQLLLSDTLFVNKRLAEFYQLGDASKLTNDRFEPVSVDSTQRAGVMTHPYMLAALAYRETTSPIHRGVFLTRRIMNRALNPPPMAIEFNNSKFDPHLTMREKVTELTKATACQACHSIINPLGFSLEHFDAVGRFRESEQNKPINSSSDYTTINGETFRLANARDVAQFAAESENSQLGFIEAMLHHLVKQPAAAYGEQTLPQLRDEFAQGNFNMQRLIVDIVKHTALHGVDQ